MPEDPIVTALKSYIDSELNDIDVNLETPVDEEFDNYRKLYHNKIIFNEINQPIGLTFIEDVNGFVKIKFRALKPEVVINPLKLNNTVSDGSFYFLDQIPSD